MESRHRVHRGRGRKPLHVGCAGTSLRPSLRRSCSPCSRRSGPPRSCVPPTRAVRTVEVPVCFPGLPSARPTSETSWLYCPVLHGAAPDLAKIESTAFGDAGATSSPSNAMSIRPFGVKHSITEGRTRRAVGEGGVPGAGQLSQGLLAGSEEHPGQCLCLEASFVQWRWRSSKLTEKRRSEVLGAYGGRVRGAGLRAESI